MRENLRPPLPSGGGELEQIQFLLCHMSVQKPGQTPLSWIILHMSAIQVTNRLHRSNAAQV